MLICVLASSSQRLLLFLNLVSGRVLLRSQLLLSWETKAIEESEFNPRLGVKLMELKLNTFQPMELKLLCS